MRLQVLLLFQLKSPSEMFKSSEHADKPIKSLVWYERRIVVKYFIFYEMLEITAGVRDREDWCYAKGIQAFVDTWVCVQYPFYYRIGIPTIYTEEKSAVFFWL